MFHIPQYSIQNRHVHMSVLNGVLWDMEQVHSGICEIGQLWAEKPFCKMCFCLWFINQHVSHFQNEKEGHMTQSYWLNLVGNNHISGLILGLHPSNEGRRYKITPFLIGWAQT